MKKTLILWATIVIVIFTAFVILALTGNSANASEDDSCPVVPPSTVYVDRFIDRPVYVDRNITHVITRDVPVDKIVKVEVPVYETNPETSDPKILRAMMKVTHDRYLALLAKYRALKPRR